MTMNKTKGLLVIQYNWEECFRKNEKTWTYFKPLNQPSHHGYAEERDFAVISHKPQSILLQYVPKKFQVLFVGPVANFKDIHKRSIISLDVADGGLAISASNDNKLHVWETNTGMVRRDLLGHLFDVYSCRIFPSGIVGLSGSADMQVKIWDLATGICPVTLKGHTAPITDMAIIERGKNVITVCKDGTAKLWNCAEAKCIDTLFEAETSLNCCSLIHAEETFHVNENQEVARNLEEFGTHRKILAIGCEDGKLLFISVSSRTVLACHFLSSSILCLTWLSSSHLVIGLEDGRIAVIHLSHLNSSPEILSHDSSSAVLCLKSLRDGFLAGRKDGIVQFYTVDGVSTVQLTGPDCDPVYDISSDSQFVYTACRDAVIRKYRIEDMF